MLLKLKTFWIKKLDDYQAGKLVLSHEDKESYKKNRAKKNRANKTEQKQSKKNKNNKKKQTKTTNRENICSP